MRNVCVCIPSQVHIRLSASLHPSINPSAHTVNRRARWRGVQPRSGPPPLISRPEGWCTCPPPRVHTVAHMSPQATPLRSTAAQLTARDGHKSGPESGALGSRIMRGGCRTISALGVHITSLHHRWATGCGSGEGLYLDRPEHICRVYRSSCVSVHAHCS